MGIKETLSRLMQDRGENPHSLSLKTKVPQPTIFRIVEGVTPDPRRSTVEKLARFFGKTADEMYGQTHSSSIKEPSAPSDDFVAVSRVKLTLSAGVTGYEVQQLEGNGAPIFFRRDYLETRRWKPDKLFALKVSGDSMEPALFDGDLVVVNTSDTTPTDGEVFAINYEGQAVIKRLRRDAGVWWIDSDNPRHKSKQCDEHAILIGRICYRQTEKI